MNLMGHIAVERLMDYVDGVASDVETSAIADHLGTCKHCSELKQELQSLVFGLKEDASYEPPAELLQWGINLFQPIQRPKTASIPKFIASLVFDTFDQPMFAGVRRASLPPRQLLFRAGDVDIDVKIESTESSDRVSFAGQVLSGDAAFVSKAPVKLESHGIVRYRTTTNDVGEFSFDEVPKDTYHLSVDLPDGQITLFCVNRDV